jgi:hypothetical protein
MQTTRIVSVPEPRLSLLTIAKSNPVMHDTRPARKPSDAAKEYFLTNIFDDIVFPSAITSCSSLFRLYLYVISIDSN